MCRTKHLEKMKMTFREKLQKQHIKTGKERKSVEETVEASSEQIENGVEGSLERVAVEWKKRSSRKWLLD
ncbi:hypothetical protein Nepgr_009295 [Nepenthes gracilis]|uniref:Uncharacterized protein n=1 Tax=Nepenthes gracilis TaxID=150966 RepID=A0AAD3XK78_NEPGR|nr:hypothetical protein Nepgr_009295 [Nepenthes gracilis]